MTRTSALAVALTLACAPAALAAGGGQLINGKQQFVDINGAPLVGGWVYVYQPGTTTPATTYQDSGLTIANTSPIQLDGRGQAILWAPQGLYREQVFDSQGDLIWDQATSAVGSAFSVLSPGATIGTSGDVACTGTTFTGATNITLPCTIAAASTSTAGLVRLTTAGAAAAGTSAMLGVTPAALAAVTQGQTMTYVVDIGSAPNTIVVDPIPQWSAYTAGETIQVKLANAITGPATIAVNLLSPVSIRINGLDPGVTFARGQILSLAYDGNFFQIEPAAGVCVTSPNITPSAGGSGVFTHNLGVIPSRVFVKFTSTGTQGNYSPGDVLIQPPNSSGQGSTGIAIYAAGGSTSALSYIWGNTSAFSSLAVGSGGGTTLSGASWTANIVACI